LIQATPIRFYLNVEPVVSVRIDNPKEVGADRLVNALGAVQKYKGNLIIIDSGTATTFDVVSEDKYFEGGIIAPGINLSVKALHEAAAQLPRGLIDGLVRKIIEEDGREFTVIGTGGVASLFQGASETIQHYDSNLTIDGLYELWCLYWRDLWRGGYARH